MQLLRLSLIAVGLATVTVATVAAQTPAAPPPAVTATCKDGTTWMGSHRSGACRGHHGVQAFNATPAPIAAAPTGTAPPQPPPITPPALSPATAATLGGAGQVWVNTSSHVYHCQGDRDYGHTKQGGYMTEAAAKAAGARPSRGKVCS